VDQEPSILDYLKSLVSHTLKGTPLPPILGAAQDGEASGGVAQAPASGEEQPVLVVEAAGEPAGTGPGFPWRTLLALVLALIGQGTFEPRPERGWLVGTAFYLAALGMLIGASRRGELALVAWTDDDPGRNLERQEEGPSWLLFIIALLLGLAAFWFFAGDEFSALNVVLWLAAIVILCWSLWVPTGKNILRGARQFLAHPTWEFKIDPWVLLVLAAFAIAALFRTYQLAQVPSQMISDHAEKLLDVQDVLRGQTSVYFPRNTGREFFQFYLTTAIILLFKTGVTFMSLKIGTVLAGLVTVVYIYLIGKEMGSRRSALLALAFAGIAYWPNVISRFGLRFPLYPVFYAAALYYFLRGLRTRQRNYFIFSGLALGLGLNGYSPYRVVPLILVVAFALYMLHRQSQGYRPQAVWGLFSVVMVSLFVCLPLLRYTVKHPEVVAQRTVTRLTGAEQPLPGPPGEILVSNLWRGLTMFGWDDGEVWVLSVTHRPALDLVSAALFYSGLVLLVIRYARQRHWFDLFTLISIPLLLMPSVLSLAFPAENPSLNRPAGVIVPVFLVIGLMLDAIMSAVERAGSGVRPRALAWGLVLLLFAWSGLRNYDLVFRQYRQSFDASAWNTSEMGKLVADFARLTGSEDTAWLVGFPYWADSRLVMINAGFPDRDNAIWPEQFNDTLSDPGPKMFLINMTDTADLEALQALYPLGALSQYRSDYPGHDFLVFSVPATESEPVPGP
jgi:hypothetical protein